MNWKFVSYKEIIAYAIGREVKAHRLYMDLSKVMVHPETQQLCEELANEELEHKARLEQEMARKYEFVSPADLSAYKIPDRNVNIFKNRRSMLSFAIKKEQEAAGLYRKLAELIRNEDARQLFMWLAEEESRHKQQVGLEYNNCLK